jgi:hypothetical protein
MSARITPRARPAGDHAGALETAFAPCAHQVYRILLECKRPPDTWRTFQDLDVANDALSPLAPDELVSECMSYMRSEQDERGPAKFRASAYGKKDDGSEFRLFVLEAGIDPPSTEDQRKTQEANAIVETNSMLRRFCEDMHREHVALLKVAIEVPRTFVDVVKSIPENLRASTEFFAYKAKALELAYTDKKEERESIDKKESDRAETEAKERMWAKLTDKLEPLAMFWLAKVMAEAGMDPSAMGFGPGAAPSANGPKVTQEPSPTATTVKAFTASLTDEEKVKIIDTFSDDALAILFAAGDAPTEQAALACLRKLREVLEGHDARAVGMTLRGIVGDRMIPLVPIFTMIWKEAP